MKNSDERRLTLRQKRFFTIFINVLVILFSFAVAIIIGKPMVEFVNRPEKFREFVKSYGIVSDMVFIAMVVFQIVIAIIPGEPFEIAAGYTFGYIRGTLDCMIGFAIGSALVYFIVRRFGVRIVELFFSADKIKSLKFLQNSKRLNIVTFLVFMIPGSPKDLLSYFVGLTDIKFPVWMFIATVARIPSLITSVIGGNALGSKKYEFTVLIFAITVIISAVGLIIYNKLSDKHCD